jgi:ATP-dependent DNA helicase DinG
MTSATLTANNSFDFFRERIGLEGGRQLVIDSPFHNEKNVLLYLPLNMVDPASRDSTNGRTFEGDVIKTVRDILAVTGGRTLALFTSHNLLRKTHGALQSLTGITTLRQGEQDSYRLINLFKETNDSVLLGTTTFWQGIDIPGNDLECVVITKLPFQNPDDPVVEARVERLLKEGKDPFNSYQVPQAILLFRQGFGRLIRRTDDRGVVAILDPRVRTKSYGSRFLNSIPRCRRSDSLNEVKGFLGVEP